MKQFFANLKFKVQSYFFKVTGNNFRSRGMTETKSWMSPCWFSKLKKFSKIISFAPSPLPHPDKCHQEIHHFTFMFFRLLRLPSSHHSLGTFIAMWRFCSKCRKSVYTIVSVLYPNIMEREVNNGENTTQPKGIPRINSDIRTSVSP